MKVSTVYNCLYVLRNRVQAIRRPYGKASSDGRRTEKGSGACVGKPTNSATIEKGVAEARAAIGNAKQRLLRNAVKRGIFGNKPGQFWAKARIIVGKIDWPRNGVARIVEQVVEQVIIQSENEPAFVNATFLDFRAFA